MPTVDADEYIRFRPGLFTGDYLRTAWDQLANNSNGKDSTPEVSSIVFQRVNFERASDDPDLEISTVYRYPFYKNCWTKIVDPWAFLEFCFLYGLGKLQDVIP